MDNIFGKMCQNTTVKMSILTSDGLLKTVYYQFFLNISMVRWSFSFLKILRNTLKYVKFFNILLSITFREKVLVVCLFWVCRSILYVSVKI